MEGFSRIDIYDTKGLEYLFVIGYLLVLIIFWRLSGKQVALKAQIKNILGILTPVSLKIPQGLFFNRKHTWVHLEDSGSARVGMDDFLMHITGDVKIDSLKNTGENINKGDLLAEIYNKDNRLKVYSPISGEIVLGNMLLNDYPEIINTDPYENGWVYKIKPSNWVNETKSYFLAEEANRWFSEELERFKEFLTGMSMRKYASKPSMILLQDGGELRDNILTDLPGEVWDDFQKEFLNFNQTKD